MKGLFIGLTAIDLIYPLNSFPEENTKIRAKGEKMDIGGPATNAAFAFAALGGHATLVSWIGKHALTRYMREKLEHYNIKHVDLNPQLEKDPIVSCIILNVRSGSRTIVTAQVDMNIPVMPPKLELKDFDIICVDGFFGDYVIELLKKNNRSTPIVFDGGSHKAHTDRILPWVNYPIFSEHFKPPNAASMRTYLADLGVEHYAVTRGEKPILGFESNHALEIEVPNISAIDSLAAGDIFHGAFCKFILEDGTEFRSALRRASEIASLSCQFIGPRKWAELI